VPPTIAAFETIFVLEMDFTKPSARTDCEGNRLFLADIILGDPDKPLTNLPQRHEGSPQLLNEQVGLFKSSKVTTPIKLIPVDKF
jgi:hypothetical protein